MTSEEIQELRERSKHDNTIIAGSEVRSLCVEIDRLLAEVERLRKALGDALSLAMELDGEPGWYERYKSLADILADGAPVADVATGRTNGTETEAGTGADSERVRGAK